MTREDWLVALAKQFEKTFKQNSAKLPKYRITCGPPSRGAFAAHKRTIGQCFAPTMSADKTTEIIISMTQDHAMTVAGVLAHEMVHAVVGVECGHRGPFRKLALAIGLKGKMTATTESPAFKKMVRPWLRDLGKYPHAAVDWSKRPKQSTRMLKAECDECGYTVRITRKWVSEVGAPHCPHHGEMSV